MIAGATLLSRLQRWLLLAAPLAVLGGFVAGQAMGYRWGRAQCVAAGAQAQTLAFERAVKDATERIKRTQHSAAQRELQRGQIEQFFARLEQEAARDAPAAVDDCVLPAGRLRRWAAANAGAADPGPAGSEPDDAAAGVAAAGVGPDARPGVEPPGGGAPVPLAGQSAVPAAGAPGDPP